MIARSQNPIDGRPRFEFSNDARQRRPVMVRLGLLHPPLPVFIAEELEHLRERLLGIVYHISERPALAVVQELFPRDGHFGHLEPPVVRNRPAADT
jgi:hypothetical protein